MMQLSIPGFRGLFNKLYSEINMEIILISLALVIVFAQIIRISKKRKRERKYNQLAERNFDRHKELIETVTKLNRGTYAERNLVVKLLNFGIPAQTIFHDLYVKKINGTFSQIDLVVATSAGIIVFEVKDYSGWIFGKGFQEQWTQVMAYGSKKYRFYNPIKQNNKHIIDLRNTLKQFQNIPFYSIIVFYGDCSLRDISFVPEGTYVVKSDRVSEVLRIIQAKDPAPYKDKHEVIRILKESVENGENRETEQQHIDRVTNLLGKDRVLD